MMTRPYLQAAPPVLSLPRGRALVVDQDQKDRLAYAETLRRMGFEVNAVTSCHDALRCLEKVPVDFVFVNQDSSDSEWQKVVERIVEHDRYTPAVVLTRELDVGCYLEAIYLGAMDYVEKPLTPAQMERLVTTYWHPRTLRVR